MPNTIVAHARGLSQALTVLVLVAAVLLGTSVALWAYFGTTVFFDMLAAGLAYCF